MVGTGILSNNMRSPLPNVTQHSGWWPSTVTPSIDQTLHQFFTLLLILTLLPNLTFYLIASRLHRTFATGAACQQRTLTPPDTWSCPILGLASVLMLRLISPELVLFPDFWVLNIPRYFCFALIVWHPHIKWTNVFFADLCTMEYQSLVIRPRYLHTQKSRIRSQPTYMKWSKHLMQQYFKLRFHLSKISYLWYC